MLKSTLHSKTRAIKRPWIFRYQRTTNTDVQYTVFPAFVLIAALFQLLLTTGCDRTEIPHPIQMPEVGVITIQTESVCLTTELPGRTVAYRTAEIRPQVSGILKKRFFEEGADVQAGALLYQIDSAPFEAALKSARATLAQAQAGLETSKLRAGRYEELIADNAVSRQDYDDVKALRKQGEAQVLAGQAAVQSALINLEYTRITASITGYIGRSDVTEGALVNAYQPVGLTTIQQLDPIYVDVPQSSTELLQLRQWIETGHLTEQGSVEKEVRLLLADGSEYSQAGRLQFQDVSVDPTTGSVILRAVFPNHDNILLPGMFVRARIIEGVNNHAILVPQQCVVRTSKGEPFIWVVDSVGVVGQRMLTLVRAIKNRWLVASGLEPGDCVVVDGIQRIRVGAKVRTVPFKTETQGLSTPESIDATAPTTR